MARLDTPPPEGGHIPYKHPDGTEDLTESESHSVKDHAQAESLFDESLLPESTVNNGPATPASSTSPLLDDDQVPNDKNVHTVVSNLPITAAEKSAIVQSYYEALCAGNLDIIPQQITSPRAGGNAHLGERRPACAVFGGQGLRGDYLQELKELSETYASLIRDLLQSSCELLFELAATDAVTAKYYHKGLDILLWLRQPEQTPDAAYLRSAPVSAPLIGLTQLIQYAVTCKTLGLAPGQFCTRMSATTGHSQGVITAAAIASATDWSAYQQAMRTALTTLFWIGVRSQQVWDSQEGSVAVSAAMQQDSLHHDERNPTPMLSVRGLSRAALQECLHSTNRYLGASRASKEGNGGREDQQPRAGLEICMVNGPEHFVVSGPPRHLYGLNLQIRKAKRLQIVDGLQDARSAAAATSRFLDVSVPFHSAHVEAAVPLILRDIGRLGISRAALMVPVFGTEEPVDLRIASPCDGADNILPTLVELAVCRKVDWAKTLQAMAARRGELPVEAVGLGQKVMPTMMLDFGPGGVHGICSLLPARTRQDMTAVMVGAWGGGKRGLGYRGDLYVWAQQYD
ncbi:acyl transferase/acyl hydrolase/lysophospholipase [Microdochium bolleyi]|uniref:Acyl transferase/acyl hydrolase/lysophospholipase n=1 Tax=Microdochium bolleyi TaxID=196109 RepID=A0A136ILQ2_9PEZI|nr:acyl transferase/acyl hydrolase/lysophospholipase [Microdochium bolleyi]